MTDQLKEKLSQLPKTAGVYFHKDKHGETIYIGKAAVLRNRVRQYFQKSRLRDPKTDALVAEIADTDWIETETEMDALFLEAEMIRRYLPKYNILLRDDKSLSYVRIDFKSDYPTVSFTRRPLDDGAEYYGPYIHTWAVKRALKYLRRVFPYAIKRNEGALGSKLYQQIGLDPGLDSGKTTLEQYRKNLRQLGSYLRGNRQTIMRDIEREMKQAAHEKDFERAAKKRNQLFELKALSKQIIFSDREFLDMSKDKGLQGLSDLLSISPPKRVEGFDISHMSGRDVVASMVVFEHGLPDKKSYRKFKLRVQQNNDFASMREVIGRRLSDKNRKAWGVPNLFLIDGGKGQLTSALDARDSLGLMTIPMIGLAKREEEIIVDSNRSVVHVNEQFLHSQNGTVKESGQFEVVQLLQSHDIVKLLQRIRDESHRFAVSYHSTLKAGRQSSSWLDEVPGVGPATKRKLIRSFGSSRGVLHARTEELTQVVGVKQAAILKQYIRAQKKQEKNNEVQDEIGVL